MIENKHQSSSGSSEGILYVTADDTILYYYSASLYTYIEYVEREGFLFRVSENKLSKGLPLKKETRLYETKEEALLSYYIEEQQALQNTIEITENKLRGYNEKMNVMKNSPEYKNLVNKYPELLI